jgi:hypothetical protein
VENYFNYFTEIEEHFQKCFGGALLLSTVDWALIEVWKDAGIPLEAVLRGIDVTNEHYDRRPSKTRKVNSLGFCAQEVLAAAEEMKEAAVGSERSEGARDAGFQKNEIVVYLTRAAQQLEAAKLRSEAGISVSMIVEQTARGLRDLADEIQGNDQLPRLENLERRLTVAEEKLFAALLLVSSENELVSVRAEADRELSSYRSKMTLVQIEQLQKQYLRKRLFERHGLPRLSLFYM